MKIYIDRIIGSEREAGERLVRDTVKKEYGIEAPKICRDAHGKPCFSPDIGVCFSISHSAEYVICAVDSEPLGVDIQQIRPVLQKTVARICTDRELENLDFFSLWCLKESFIKLKGQLDRNYHDMEFLPLNEMFSGPDYVFGALPSAPQDYKIAVCSYVRERIQDCTVFKLF